MSSCEPVSLVAMRVFAVLRLVAHWRVCVNGNSGNYLKRCSVGPTVVRCRVITDAKLANMTVVEALDAGEEPRVVWNVLCDQMEVPDSKRWGHDHNAPPMPAV